MVEDNGGGKVLQSSEGFLPKEQRDRIWANKTLDVLVLP